MANKNLTDLTARTATADSDLIHVNSGGTDYKETKANFLSNITSSISSLNSSLTNSCKIVYVSGNAGAISAGAHGYISVPYTVPSGYKTTGLFGLSIGHPGAAGNAGFQVSGSLGTGLTGEQTAYVSYIAQYGSLSASNSDFALYIHCVPTSWTI